jgi:hypothetical protein
MTKTEAIKTLKQFLKWRKGKTTKMLDPKLVTEAIETVIKIK